ncbi:MAG: transcriptional regulator [Chloroflexota bacterium]
MNNIFQELANLDRLIHEPARLAVLTALASCQKTDFLFLQRLTGLSAGNLSVHLSKLEDAGLVKSEKKIVAKRTQTHVNITEEGRDSIARYWEKIETLRNDAENWKLDE